VLPPKLEELRYGLEETRRITLGLIAGLPEAAFAVREDGEWSIADILEHLIIAEMGTSKVIRKMLKECAGRLPPYPADDSVLVVRVPKASLEGATQAPDVAQPKGGREKEELLAAAADARAQTIMSIEALAGADPRAAEFPHPLFGSLNLFEWPYLIILQHERQHHAQIVDILRKRGRQAGKGEGPP
jgi:hypothetical protein